MQEFRMRGGGFVPFLAPFIAPLVLFFPVCLLLFAILLRSTAAGIALAAVATAGLAGVLWMKHRRLVSGTVVRFSAQGVELVDGHGFQLRLAWQDIDRIDVVESRMASPRTLGRPGGLRVKAGAMRSTGLVGWGERVVPQRVPGWMRAQLARVPVDPETGKQWLGIPLGAIDPLWERGGMGDWIRRYRADLLA